MQPEKKHHAVNWVDGMKLNKDHFISFERWTYDLNKDGFNFTLSDNNFGLLEPLPDKDSALDFLVNIDEASQLNIKVLMCRAITRGGYRIEITPDILEVYKYPEKNLSADFNIGDANSEEFAIIISSDPDERMPIGIPQAEEIPFRHPSVMPTYRIHVVPTRQINSSQFWSNHLTIGKFLIIAGEVQFQENYIPPCSRLEANSALVDYFHNFKNNQEKITKAAMEYQKIKRQSSQVLEQNISFLLEKIIFFSMHAGYANESLFLSQSPAIWVDYYVKLAKTLKTAQNCLAEYQREEMLNYFNQWISIRDFENALYDLINLQYNHQDILKSITAIDTFLSVLYEIVNKLVYSDKSGGPKEKSPQPSKSKVKIVRVNK